MTTESVLVKTKDNNVIVFSIDYANEAQKARLLTQCRSACQDKTYRELCRTGISVSGATVDTDNTNFIREEIAGYHYRKEPQEYRNGLSSDNQPQCPANTFQFDYTIPDDSVPEVFKNIGGKIETRDNTYDVELVGDRYQVRDFDKTTASFFSGSNVISVVRNQFRFPPREYAQLQTMIHQFESAKAADPNLDIFDFASRITDNRSYSLFNIYANEYRRVQHHDITVSHEIKHLKNRIFYDGLSIKKDAKRLSVEDCYRLSVEDERSAYLNQVISGVNKYLRGGNLQDYSMFDTFSSDFAQTLRDCSSDAERVALATNMSAVVNYALTSFDAHHKNSYDANQFAGNTSDLAREQPVMAQPDTDREWFKKIRSLYYNFEIYNPQTGQMEHKNLAQYITPESEVKINTANDVRRQSPDDELPMIDVSTAIIEPARRIMQEKMDRISGEVGRGQINPEIIEQAKALMRDSVRQTSYIDQVDNFRVSTLYEDENNNQQPSQSPTEPQPEQIPNDHAGWSDRLQAYWQNVDGYQEVSKNNAEYKFKINDATVKYSAQNKVEVSRNADYDLYDKLLKEPTNKTKPVEFLDTLTQEQALTLYIACINNGRRPVGAVPRDLSGIDHLQGIPESELRKFRQLTGESSQGSSQRRSQNESQRQSVYQIMNMRRSAGR